MAQASLWIICKWKKHGFVWHMFNSDPVPNPKTPFAPVSADINDPIFNPYQVQSMITKEFDTHKFTNLTIQPNGGMTITVTVTDDDKWTNKLVRFLKTKYDSVTVSNNPVFS